MNEKEMGQMEAQLHTVVIRSRDMMSSEQKAQALEDMAGYMLDIHERVKVIESLVGKLKCTIHE